MKYRISLVVLAHEGSKTDFFTHIQKLEKPSTGRRLSNILNFLPGIDERYLVFLAKPVISTTSKTKT
jgi:hypothetical protein